MKIAVIGGGISGLSIAYNLALRNAGEIHVYEKKWITYGSSTRSGARFRVHFWREENSKFAIESIKRLEKLSTKMEWNPVIYRGGYLWLITKENIVEQFRDANKMWSRLGVPGIFLDQREVKERYPYIMVDDILSAFYGPQNGSYHHDYVCFGYYSLAKSLGVHFHEMTTVDELIVSENKVKYVKTDKGEVDVDIVVLATGAWTNTLLEKLRISLPTEPLRREVCLTEPYHYFIEPLIIDTESSAYFGQTLKGEILGSVDYPTPRGLIDLDVRFKVISAWARAISKRVPLLKNSRIMRTWAGYYMMSLDESHIMGRDPEWPEGLYVAFGYSGHGFMMAPLVGELLAENIITGRVDELMKPFLPTRFKENKLIKEKMVIG
ncbi:MAG: FAD-binding oxidoreductase [Aigarchaeota archaeon]|nr:FAD-binding oxidoreductase [Aigarchaeota archaeon]MCX8193402.1 FAD-binding oxidoreductase [Nitrososphaeria archaeon]MDW7985932.1 FAD-binding oxidoreductase [Nitrososphaerota archaeon]